MAQQVKRYLGTLLAQANTTMPDKVRQLVHVLLPTGMCSVDRVAQHLGVDRRTVHRRLAQEDRTYSDIVNEARATLVVRYIATANGPCPRSPRCLGSRR